MLKKNTSFLLLKLNWSGARYFTHESLAIYYVPSTALSAKDTVKNKDNKFSHRDYVFFTVKYNRTFCFS